MPLPDASAGFAGSSPGNGNAFEAGAPVLGDCGVVAPGAVCAGTCAGSSPGNGNAFPAGALGTAGAFAAAGTTGDPGASGLAASAGGRQPTQVTVLPLSSVNVQLPCACAAPAAPAAPANIIAIKIVVRITPLDGTDPLPVHQLLSFSPYPLSPIPCLFHLSPVILRPMPRPASFKAISSANRPLLVVRSSSIHAAGCYTLSPIAKGRRVLEYDGPRISKELADERYQGRPVTYLFGFLDKRDVIDGFGTGMFINHSCSPNCETEEVDSRIFIRTLRAIAPGEELLYEYNLYDADPGDNYDCYCGAPHCRGTMLSNDELKRQARNKARKAARNRSNA
jgi:hypothetical protein